VRFGLILMFFCAATFQSFAQWVQCNGPYGGNISFIGQNTSTKTVFAGSSALGLFRYTAQLNAWEGLQKKFQTPEIDGIAVFKNQIFVSNSIYGLFRSADDGNSWENVIVGGQTGNTIDMLSSDDSNLILRSNYVFYSTKDGNQFTAIGSLPSSQSEDYIKSFNGRLFTTYLDTANNYTIAFSDDNGTTWQKPLTSIELFYHGQYEALRFYSDKIYFLYYNLVFVSSDLGNTWTEIIPQVTPFNTWNDICVSGNHILLSGNYQNQNAYLSTDGGNTYSLDESDFFSSMKANQFLQTTYGLFAATAYGVFASADSGNTWTDFNQGLYANPVDYMIAYNSELWVGLGSSEILGSSNGGLSWKKHNCGLESVTYNNGITGMASLDGRVIVASPSTGTYYSDDGGQNWEVNGTNTFLYNFLVDGNRIYAWCEGSIVYSDDKGNNWFVSVTPDGNCNTTGMFAIGPNVDVANICYGSMLQAPTFDLLQSGDGGNSYVQKNLSLYIGDIAVINSSFFGLTTPAGVVKSVNGDSTWYVISGIQNPNGLYVLDTNYLVIGTGNDSIYLSLDSGNTFLNITGNFTGLPSEFFYLGKNLYVGTPSSGIWKRDLSQFGIPFSGEAIIASSRSSEGLIIFPNPARNYLNVILPQDSNWSQNIGIAIYNTLGQVVYKNVSSGNSGELHLFLGNLSKGVYVLELNKNNENSKMKFVVN